MAVDKLLIRQNIHTSLQAILVANGYRTNVDTVERQIKVWGEVGANSMPFIGWAIGDTTRSTEQAPAGNLIKCDMPLKIVAHVNEQTAADLETTVTNLEDDIIGALCEGSNTHRGSDANGPNAIHTLWLKTVDDVHEPNVKDSRGGWGTLEMDFLITFMRTTGRSPA